MSASKKKVKLTKDFPVFDCDGHVDDHDAVWTDYVDPRHRDLVKQTYWKEGHRAILNGRTEIGGGNSREALHTGPLNYSGITVAGPGMNKKLLRRINCHMKLTPEQRDYLDHQGAYDPIARTREMDLMGIDQAMIIPTLMVNHVLYAENADGAAAVYHAYNNWLADYCNAAPDRLFGAAMLPMHTPSHATRELALRASQGFRVGLVRPIDARGRYPNRIFGAMGGGMPANYDGFYRTFQETGMVLGMHTFPSLMVEPSPTVVSPGDLVHGVNETEERVPSQIGSFIFEAMTWLSQVLLSGFLDRYPRLTMAILESNATWLPALLERCDRLFRLYRNERLQPAKRLPTEAFYDQCFIAFEGDEKPVFRQWELFEDHAIWSSDAYHHDGTDSWNAIREMEAEEVPISVQAKMLGANARRMYRIEGKLSIREQLDIPRPDWFPRQDAEFDRWWEMESNPRKHRTREETGATGAGSGY